MKRREGWVSNSSSSSFCILGYTEDELKLPEDTYLETMDNGILSHHYGISEYYEMEVIGLPPSGIPDDMTIAEAKKKVDEELTSKGVEILDDATPGWIIDGGYDG